ncbi:prolyl-tRNA synthetase-like protein [Xylogone sp. PMI_703]|nr:prolyl-tRNA synthetase-like protein [Xylogone sp. PMI_703]
MLSIRIYRPRIHSSLVTGTRRWQLQCSTELNVGCFSYRYTTSALHTDDALKPHPISDNRARLSGTWIPTGGIAATQNEDAHSKLIRAGFLRQAHSGIFHLLPLGLRVQDKLETLIDKHMAKLGASKLSMSSISSEEIWTRSGRLKPGSVELFRFQDRKGTKYLLSPTHEEEITALVSSVVKSYKELPVRVYQISRKYRDELRPRHALATYNEVRKAYAELFNELKMPYLVAEADSGDIGGNLSHEFHFPTSKGEDHIVSCSTCDYVANEELAESSLPTGTGETGGASPAIQPQLRVWRGISQDRLTMINVWYPAHASQGLEYDRGINIYAIKSVFPELDASVEDPLPIWAGYQSLESRAGENPSVTESRGLRLLNIVDGRLPEYARTAIESIDSQLPFWPISSKSIPSGISTHYISSHPLTGQSLNLLRIKDGDTCPRCSHSTLSVQKAIELGHTFHLGTRYSEPMKAMVTVPSKYVDQEIQNQNTAQKNRPESTVEVPMQMGCHGIGISRMISAVAENLADERGLNWPRVMAPYEVVIVPANGLEDAAVQVYDTLQEGHISDLDVVLDDRQHPFPWKMGDADLIGYPVIIVVGKQWRTEQLCEVQCRRLQVKDHVRIDQLSSFVGSLLDQL